MIDLGDVYTNGFEVRNASDVLATPSSNVCTLTLPDGTSTTPTLTVASTGVLRLDYATTQAGRHTGRLVTVNPDSAHTFEFDVDAAATGIVSLADVRAHLNLSATTDDDEVRRFIRAATSFFEKRLGAVTRQPVSQIVTPASDGSLFLSSPVISLTAITDTYGYGYTYNVATYVADGTRVVSPLAYTTTYCRPVTVAYIGGYAVVPDDLREAVLDYIKWKWLSQRGASPLPIAGGEFEIQAPATVPYEIMNVIETYRDAVVA